MHAPISVVYRKVTLDFMRVWGFLTVFKVFYYFSVDRGLGPMASESELAIGAGVRESIYIYICIYIYMYIYTYTYT